VRRGGQRLVPYGPGALGIDQAAGTLNSLESGVVVVLQWPGTAASGGGRRRQAWPGVPARPPQGRGRSELDRSSETGRRPLLAAAGALPTGRDSRAPARRSRWALGRIRADAGRAVAARSRPPRRRAAATAHVGGGPARADGIDEDPVGAQLAGKEAGECVERGLGDAVGGGAPGHLGDRAAFAADVDDPRVRAASQQREKRNGGLPGTEEVGVECLIDHGEISMRSPQRRADGQPPGRCRGWRR
jgi:hypothetical protein